MKRGILFLAILLGGCAAQKPAKSHPPKPRCSHGAWSQTEHCACEDPYQYDADTKQCTVNYASK